MMLSSTGTLNTAAAVLLLWVAVVVGAFQPGGPLVVSTGWRHLQSKNRANRAGMLATTTGTTTTTTSRLFGSSSSPQQPNENSNNTPTPSNRATDVTITKAVKSQLTNVKSSTTLRTIDETIYNFNKVVIDTVYDIICFLYPVRGTERDFARFYVLETVARVPYFAYLSVMHLRGMWVGCWLC